MFYFIVYKHRYILYVCKIIDNNPINIQNYNIMAENIFTCSSCSLNGHKLLKINY